MSAREASIVGPWSKARIAIAVGAGLALFALASGLITWFAERPGLSRRLDLTYSGRNTLDPVLADLVDKLPERAMIEVFFRPLPKHIGAAGIDAQGRMHELLTVMQNAAPEKIKVIDHSSGDLAGSAEALARLRIDGDEYGLVVVHRDNNRVRLTLLEDLAELDFGNPDPNHYVPARLVSFRGEQALANALKRVSSNVRPKAYFISGHGERALYAAAAEGGNESRDLGALATALVDDGFEIERFEGQGKPIPEDCAVLAIVDPTQALAEAELSAIHGYVDRGGRLLVTGSHRYPDGEGSTRAIAARYGIDLGLGYVAEPIAGPNGYVVGFVECANIASGPAELQVRHPVTESLARFGRTIWSSLAHPLARKNQLSNVVLTELARSGESAWIDLPDAAGVHDWQPDKQREQAGKRIAVAYAAGIMLPDGAESTTEARQGRLIVLGSPEFLSSRLMTTNKEFALNAFNWLAAREYRLSVAPREDQRRKLEVHQGTNLVTLRSLTLFVLPGLCLILGLFTWYMRRR